MAKKLNELKKNFNMQRRKTHTQENHEVHDPSKKALELAFQ